VSSGRIGAAAVAALTLAACACACGGSGSSSGPGPAGSHTVKITISDAGCSPASVTAPSGDFKFVVQNSGSSKVTELEVLNDHNIILGERENIVPGLGTVFSLTLQPGEYTLNCPNGTKTPQGKLHVTGEKVSVTSGPAAALLKQATVGYQNYVIGETANLLAGTGQFVTALRAGNLQLAKRLFGPTRIHYEAIEPVAESFGSLDAQIDARINDVPNPAEWTGFHRIEQILWVQNTTAGTGIFATKLLADVTDLYHRVQTLTYQPAQLANGSVELLNEVANSKITGEEDRYSHTDLSDFQGNLQGARTAFELLVPALRRTGNGKLATIIEQRFADVERVLDTYRRPTPLGFALYGALTPADRLTLAREVDALAEPLSTVAAKVS
jgi:iron uptake system component EfeO